MALSLDHRTRVALTSFGLFLLAMFLTAQSAKNPQIAGVGGAVVGELSRPFLVANRFIQSGVGGVWSEYFNLIGVREENQSLRARLAVLEAQASQLIELRHEVDQLRSLTSVEVEEDPKQIAARVISFDATQWVEAVTLDRGSNHGIRPGLAVINAAGLIGQVIESGPNTSRVLLITDPVSGVDSLIQASRVRGIVQGAGNEQCSLLYVERGTEVRIGDRLVTSGLDGVFPRGVPVGVVTQVETRPSGIFQIIDVKPSVELSELDYVLVLDPHGAR